MQKYCAECDEKRDYTISEEEISMNIKGVPFTCKQSIARCSVCNAEIYIASLFNMNVTIAHEAFKSAEKMKG